MLPTGTIAPDFELFSTPDQKLIDENGIIRWSYLSPVGINPGADGILNALEELDAVAATNQ